MIKQKFKILFFLPFLISLSSFAENYPSRILFVGNSYLYYNDSIHNHVEKMLIEFYGDEEITTKSATIGGSRLHNHNIDHLLDPKNLQLDQLAINRRHPDVLSLLYEVFYPKGPFQRGNWGRWNFEGGGPLALILRTTDDK